MSIPGSGGGWPSTGQLATEPRLSLVGPIPFCHEQLIKIDHCDKDYLPSPSRSPSAWQLFIIVIINWDRLDQPDQRVVARPLFSPMVCLFLLDSYAMYEIPRDHRPENTRSASPCDDH